jgi:PAS domain S-box-containing protein
VKEGVRKTKKELVAELGALRERLHELEQRTVCGHEHDLIDEALRDSERKYRTLFENSNEAIFVAQDGRLVFLNPRTTAISGYSAEELLSKPFIEFIHQDDRAMVTDRYIRRVRGETFPERHDFRMLHKDGTIRWIELNSAVIDWNGMPATMSFLSDITQRRAAEEALRQGEDRFRSLIQSLQDMVLIIDREGRVTYESPSVSRVLGYDAGYFIGKPPFIHIHPDDIDQAVKEMEEVFSSLNDGLSSTFRYQKADGSLVYLETLGSNYFDRPGIQGVVIAARDITERKRMEEALRESGERYRSIYENAIEGIYQSTPAGRFISINPSMARMFGYESPGEMVVSITDIATQFYADPEDRERFTSLLDRQGKIDQFEYRARHKEGNVLWISVSARVVRNERGHIVYYEGRIQDITARKQAEQQNILNEARLESLLRINEYPAENIPALLDSALNEAITLTGSRIGYIYFYDEESGEFTLNTWSREVMQQCTVAEPQTVYQLDKTGIWGEAVRQARPIMVNDFAAPNPLKKGLPHGHAPLSRFLTIPVFSGDRIVAVVGVANKQDAYNDSDVRQLTLMMDAVWKIVLRRRSEEEQEKLKEELDHARRLESIGTLAGGIAHDFNNLLMGIQGHASLMRLDPSHRHHDRLKHIEELVISASDLTGQLLGFARGGRYEVRPTNMNDVVEKTASLFGRTRKEITVYRKLNKTLWAAEVDRTQMEQVLMNLFVNAWHAMPGGGEMFLQTDNVLVGQENALAVVLTPGRYVKISVMDTGTGMDAQTRERIFDPFFTTRGMGRGTGLGLATVYGIIKGHGGRIDVSSEPGHGTTFEIYMPATDKAVTDMQTTSEEEVPQGEETILLVDDEPIILDVARELLAFLGYRVHCAESGQEAVAVYHEKKDEIDLVILDMIMPGISGGETFDRLRALNPRVKVLLSSGYSVDGRAREILDRGCNGFLQKPFQLKQIAREVRAILDGKQKAS